MTADALAKRVGCGTTVQKISNYETGRNAPPHLFLHNLETRVGITASWIVAGNRASLPGWILDKMPPIS
jgi:transcriptional regulator with XRE-family HTH domain